MVVAVGEAVELPEVVFGGVVVAAQGVLVPVGGGSPVGVADAVVEVAVGGWDAASGEYTAGVPSLNVAALSGGGAAAGDPGPHGSSCCRVGDHDVPSRGGLGDLAGDVGKDGSPSGDVAGMVVQLSECFEVDA